MASTVIIKSGTWTVHTLFMNSRPDFVLPLLQQYHNSQAAVDQINSSCSHGILVILDGTETSTADRLGDAMNGGMYDHNDTPGKITPFYNRRLNRPLSLKCETLEEALTKVKTKAVFIWDGEKWYHQASNNPTIAAVNKKRGTVWSRSRHTEK